MDRLTKLEKEIAEIRKTLEEKENEFFELKKTLLCHEQNISRVQVSCNGSSQECNTSCGKTQIGDKLPRWAIERYSRQILLQNIGVSGQEKLCDAKVLVIGAGGLGCPAALYLAGAGVGEIGVVDYDTVDVTNIHRQVLHGEDSQHMSKVQSAANALRRINSHVKINTYNVQLDSSNALHIVSKYDLVLDCTDNVPTRYLLNDACALTKLPLISGSALKMEGQLTIYGYRGQNNPNEKDQSYVGPCYRCLFPTPPPPETVGSCSANGVAGPVPGVIGALQALEAIKLIVGETHAKLLVERMLLFDGDDMIFKTVKLRPRNAQCVACSDSPTITKLLDYETFCSARAKEKRKNEALMKSQRRKEEKAKRMTGQSYFGFRKTENDKKKWVQDVPKSERKMGPRCKNEYCGKGTNRFCLTITEDNRREIFNYFWNELDWAGKKKFVRSLVDTIPPKRRRLKHKGETSRKGDSKLYHLIFKEERMPVCRVTFLNTLGIKEAMVRCWLTNKERPRGHRKPIKTINVNSYIASLPKVPPKCVQCRNRTTKYIDIADIKNQYQLYMLYVEETKKQGLKPASRKTFSKVFVDNDLKIFKPKNETDICDLVNHHNVSYNMDLDIHNKVFGHIDVGYSDQWYQAV